MKSKRYLQFKKDKGKLWIILCKIGFYFYLLGAVVGIIDKFWVGLLFLAIALILSPKVHFKLENLLKTKLSWKIKILVIFTLHILIGLVTENYDKQDLEFSENKKTEQLKIDKKNKEKKTLLEKVEKERKDSLNYYYTLGIKSEKQRKYLIAISQLTYSLKFVDKGQDSILKKITSFYYKSGKYQKALEGYTFLINQNKNNSNFFYDRALCYLKLRKNQEAVNDLKQSIQLGNKKANKLHKKINPIKKRVAYYVTRCCDGSTSEAKGRGACSHHRGVCNWNDPVYETYRKY